MKNRKREICTSGTVRGEDGNILTYSATKSREVGIRRCSRDYGELATVTVAEIEGKRRRERRCGRCGSAQRGLDAREESKKTATALLEAGDRVGGADARE